MIIIGLIGILKNKWAKYKDGIAFGLEANFHLSFYFLFIMGVVFLISEIESYFLK
jgi:hypothetical protein